MSRDSHTQFLSEQPTSADECSPFDDPPPWEPQFEDLSSTLPSVPQSRRPLDPPPPCFSIPSPLRIRSHNFPPFRIPAVSNKLTDGFCMLYPHDILESHGIYRSDWIRFLEDVGIAARLSHEGLSAVGSRVPVAPLIAHRFFPSRALGAVFDGHFTRSPVEEVRALIQIWNQCAFERRKIRVTLQVRSIGMNGKKRYALIVESL
ncbi:hypothetical protein HD554DRAFT_1753946 [Boletus coccyginus]|nr:hypothetical protein HD554DRAFT_1753946 [Boletus coccyginus]